MKRTNESQLTKDDYERERDEEEEGEGREGLTSTSEVGWKQASAEVMATRK